MEVRILVSSTSAIRSLGPDVVHELSRPEHTVITGEAARQLVWGDLHPDPLPQPKKTTNASKGQITHGRAGNITKCKRRNGGVACDACKEAHRNYTAYRRYQKP